MIEKQEREITSIQEVSIELREENSKLIESLSNSLNQVKNEKKWKKESEETMSFVSQVLEEKEGWSRHVINLAKEKSEWIKQKVRQE